MAAPDPALSMFTGDQAFWLGTFTLDGGYDGQVEIEHMPCHAGRYWCALDENGNLVWLPDVLIWALNHKCPM